MFAPKCSLVRASSPLNGKVANPGLVCPPFYGNAPPRPGSITCLCCSISSLLICPHPQASFCERWKLPAKVFPANLRPCARHPPQPPRRVVSPGRSAGPGRARQGKPSGGGRRHHPEGGGAHLPTARRPPPHGAPRRTAPDCGGAGGPEEGGERDAAGLGGGQRALKVP